MASPKINTLAEERTGVALRQMQTSYLFKVPRLDRIRQFRQFYNNVVERQKRIRYNVPVPIFSGMIDTLNADLDDDLILKFSEGDPADWVAAKKVNAALDRKLHSMTPGSMWSSKFREAKFECSLTGRGFLKYSVGNEPDGYWDCLDAPTYEDMFWQPKGGQYLEQHLFRGQMNCWKSEQDLLDGAKSGLYDKKQVEKITTFGGSEYIISPAWENYDFASRFSPLGLSPEANNYVGEKMFMFVEFEQKYKGQYFYIMFEPYTMTWIRFEKLTDVCTDGYSHWMSFASHPDPKNFASKGFADDLYPIAMMMQDQINEDAENRRRRGSGARGYDKDMWPDVAKLDLAMTGRDALVPADTKGGTRDIAKGIYNFETPDITGSIQALEYLETLATRSMGVSANQQGDTDAQKAPTVQLTDIQGASKRISYRAAPIIEVGQQLGLRYFAGLRDYMDSSLAIKLYGEDGYQWDKLKRSDLNIKQDFSIEISSANQQSQLDSMKSAKRAAALTAIAQPVDPGFTGNKRTRDDFILRDAEFTEQEIMLLLDPNTQATKETLAEVSAAIELLMQGKTPPINYDANAFFYSKIYDWVKTHQDDPKVKKNLQVFGAWLTQIAPIAQENEQRRAQDDMAAARRQNLLKTASSAPLGGAPSLGGPAPAGAPPGQGPMPAGPAQPPTAPAQPMPALGAPVQQQ